MGIMSYNVKNVGLREEAKSGALIWRGWAAVGGGVGGGGASRALGEEISAGMGWELARGKNRN